LRRNGGQNLNLAVPASHVARLLLLCNGEGPLTQFPFVRQIVADLPKSANEWSPTDVENATHLVRAMRAASEAWAICRNANRPWQPGGPPEILGPSGVAQSKVGRPWLLNSSDLQEFVRLISEANREARMVRKEVLRRMHAQLPDAFNDFIISTSYIATHASVSRPDPRYTQMWRRWSEWRLTNWAEVRIPEGARP
jgi:hypothetical protein